MPVYLVNANANGTQDLQGATQIAYQMVAMLGMSDALGNMDFWTYYGNLSSETKLKIEQEVTRFVEEGKTRATVLLKEKRKELDLLAKALVEYETLNLEEIKKVLKGEKLDKLSTIVKAPLKLPEIVVPPGMGEESSSPPAAAARKVDPEPDSEQGGGVGGAQM